MGIRHMNIPACANINIKPIYNITYIYVVFVVSEYCNGMYSLELLV